MLNLVKRTLNWLVFFLGLLTGVFALSLLGAWEVGSDGFWAAWIEQGRWRFLLAWLSLGLVAIILSWIAIRNRKLAGFLFLVAAPILAFRAHVSNESFTTSLTLPIFAVLTLVGLFWHLTGASGWPPIWLRLAETKHGAVVRFAVPIVLACSVISGAALIAILPQQGAIADCGPAQPFSTSRYPGHAVFLARVPSLPFAIVQEHFWGLLFWSSKFALIAHGGVDGSLPGGKTYYLDGRRVTGLVTRFLPIIELTVCGGRTRPAQNAVLDLRILREGSSPGGVRVIGQVSTGGSSPTAGVRVLVVGPSRTIAVITDKDGIYDLPNLPGGRYEVLIDGCKTKDRWYPCDIASKSDLTAGDIFAGELEMPRILIL